MDRFESKLADARPYWELTGIPGSGNASLWVRIPELDGASAAALAMIGDFVPYGIGQALGVRAGGNSLDNTIRVGHLTTTGWVLLAAHLQQVANGFGYGRAELWAQDGTLLGEVSQSAVMRQHSRIRDAGLPPRA